MKLSNNMSFRTMSYDGQIKCIKDQINKTYKRLINLRVLGGKIVREKKEQDFMKKLLAPSNNTKKN